MFMNFYVSKELENHCLTAIANIYILHTTDHYKLKICMILVYLNVVPYNQFCRNYINIVFIIVCKQIGSKVLHTSLLAYTKIL